jgi:hypothetical protein
LQLGMDVDSIYKKINDARSRGIPVQAEEVAIVEPTVVEEEKPVTKTATPPRKPVPTATKKKVK